MFADKSDRDCLEAVSKLVRCNPFLPDWVRLEKEALGRDYEDGPSVHRVHRWEEETKHEHPNLRRLAEKVGALVERLRRRLTAGAAASESDLHCYRDAVLYYLYHRYRQEFDDFIDAALGVVAEGGPSHRSSTRISFWPSFRDEFSRFIDLPGLTLRRDFDPARVFAWIFHVRRAFKQVFLNIIGNSRPAIQLRADVWRSIFTKNMDRYFRTLYDKMGSFNTLITGPSGTGKELVARAIGFARYVEFDSKQERFAVDFASSFHPVNVTALTPTLIESELFGHAKGAFTGAHRDRAGWLEECHESGTVFLDELGELCPDAQVKMLRVLQSRVFQRVGETTDRRFKGKLIAATNRNLGEEVGAGRFRTDLYYRLCADRISTPSLHEQLQDSPSDLPVMIRFAARWVASENSHLLREEDVEILAQEVEGWIERNLQPEYPWPGNFRELEQCVRSVLIRGEYFPVHISQPEVPAEVVTPNAARGLRDALSAMMGEEPAFTAEDLKVLYFRLVAEKAHTYQDAAARLGVNWRTVKKVLDKKSVPPEEPSQPRRAKGRKPR